VGRNNPIRGAQYGFDEVSYRDVRYLEQHKAIVNSWTKGAHGIGTGKLVGATNLHYDVNGHLTVLDRGFDHATGEHLYSRFAYDNEGHILTRADYPDGAAEINFFEGTAQDPETMVTTSSAWTATTRAASTCTPTATPWPRPRPTRP
jgi:hypothetical protein